MGVGTPHRLTARSVEVLHQPQKARAIEVLERNPNVAPSRRGIFATDHGHEPLDDGLVSELFGLLRIHDFRKGADWPAGNPFNLVRRRLGGFDGKGKSPRAKAGVGRDT
jgi:hypothetical protein